MPWSGSAGAQSFSRSDGTRTGTTVWQEAEAASVDIISTDHDTHDQDLAAGINAALKKDGNNTPTANLPMGGFRHTNAGDGAALTQYATVNQLIGRGVYYVSTVGGTGDAVTLTTGMSTTSYAAGQSYCYICSATNTGAMTVNVDGIGAKSVKRLSGANPAASAMLVGSVIELRYDGTNFQWVNEFFTSATGAYGPTALETAASVTPTNYEYLPGDVRRYGADTTGAADSSTAWTNACKTGHVVLGGGAFTYKITSDAVLSTSVMIDGQGATLKPTGTTRCLHRNNVSLAANTTISSGATKGSRTVVVASATGIAVGQWCFFYADDSPTHAAFSYPPSWAKITAVVGTTITLDRALRVTYGGTINFRCYAATTMLDRCHIRNLTIDGSASTSAQVGDGIRVNGYREVIVENCTFKDWTYNDPSVGVVKIFGSLDVRVKNNHWIGQNNGGEASSIDDCMSGLYEGNTVDGNHFGLTMIRVDQPRFIGNALTGQLSENLDTATAKSVRGLKAYGCYFPIATGNHIHDYESAFKWEQCFGGIIDGNAVSGRPNATGYTGQIAINVSAAPGTGTNQRDTIISNNVVDGVVGTAIGVSNDPPGVVIVSSNIVKNCGAIGIYAAVANVTIASNQIENWGLRNSSDQAIYHGGLGATIRDNRFRHSTLTGLSCIRNFFGSGYVYDIGNNSVETANPLGVTLEATGTATISSGATSVTVTHGLSRTPSAAEISWTFLRSSGSGVWPTNDPGNTWVSSITSTQFTVNVRSDPGASDLNLSWRAFKTTPFTV